MLEAIFRVKQNLKRPLFLIALASILSGCVAGGGTNIDSATLARDEFDTLEMLANLTDTLFIPTYESFSGKTADFADASGVLATYCGAIDSASEAATLSIAQEEWRSLMADWQRTELFILGVVAENTNALRNRVYSYGDGGGLSTCGVDQAVVLNQQTDFDLEARPNTIRGLDTLEYLLFNDDLSETCPSQVVETQDWNERSETERKQWRCEYALTVAADLDESASEIVQGWSVDGDNFRSEFINPVNTSSSLSAVSDALFFVDKELKDLKVGGVLGRVGCTPVDCTARTEVESPYSDNALNNLHHNLQAFEDVFTGLDGSSFDDLIVSVGEGTLVDEFQASIANAITSIDLVSGSFADAAAAIQSSEDIEACEEAILNPLFASDVPICNLYGEIKVISDKLKTEFILATALDIPDRAQSDND